MNLRLIFAALAVFAVHPVTAQTPVSPPAPVAPPAPAVGSAPASTEEIVGAAQDCAAAIAPGRFELEAFRTRGWIMAGPPTTREVPGGPRGVSTQQAMFGRQGGQVLNIINVTGNLLVHCSVVARISDAAQHEAVRTSLITALTLTPATEGIAEERDRQFAQSVAEADRANLLLSPERRLTVRLQDAPNGPVVRIEIFPKRPLET